MNLFFKITLPIVIIEIVWVFCIAIKETIELQHLREALDDEVNKHRRNNVEQLEEIRQLTQENEELKNGRRISAEGYRKKLAKLKEKIKKLRSSVKEWICVECNTVFPQYPHQSLIDLNCPKCKKTTLVKKDSSGEASLLKQKLAKLKEESNAYWADVKYQQNWEIFYKDKYRKLKQVKERYALKLGKRTKELWDLKDKIRGMIKKIDKYGDTIDLTEEVDKLKAMIKEE